jgi:uncharacterized protein
MEPGMFFDCITSLGIGFLGSLHCLGMCGPLVLAYSLQISGTPTPPSHSGASLFRSGISHHLAFHLGRLVTYGFLGATASLLFQLADMDRLLLDLRSVMTLAGGVLMVLMGFALMRIIPFPGVALFSDSKAKARFSRLLGSRSPYSKMALGMAVGFLPCGLSWAMVVKAATTEQVLTGFLVMVAFGLGTVPALFLPGISASLLSLRSRLIGERLAALSVIAMGLILIFKAGRTLV